MQVKGKIMGYAKAGTFLHRDNGGKIRAESITSVNKPLTPEAGHLETTPVCETTIMTVEVEKPILDGNKFYNKDIHTEQIINKNVNVTLSDVQTPASVPEESGDGLSPLKVLKNFVDNLAADFRQDRTAQWIMIVVIGGLAVAGVVLAAMH